MKNKRPYEVIKCPFSNTGCKILDGRITCISYDRQCPGSVNEASCCYFCDNREECDMNEFDKEDRVVVLIKRKKLEELLRNEMPKM